tara:strand:+ start:611 stop:1813 length:1203 start_codon:yes stop_codon:yes gene_type:complete
MTKAVGTSPAHPALDLAIEILADLVAFPSVSLQPNDTIVSYIETRMRDLGMRCVRDAHEDGQRFNLLASAGPQRPGGVLLSGHMDVVPASPDGWTGDPFILRRDDGRLHGRGAVDMKGFIAIVLASLPDIMAQADSLSMPLHVALSFDEETGFFGASQLPAFFDSIGLRAEIAIIGEPTNMQPFVGHKGGMELTTVVTGTSGHASQPAGMVNAVYYAARLVDFMRSCADDLAAAPIEGSPFNPPHTSLSVGVIRGGEARNIIPDRCEIDWEIRAHPGDDPHQYLGRVTDFITHGLVPEMTAIDPRAGIETHMLCDAPPLEARPDGPAANLVARLWTNETPQVVSFGTDAPFFQKAGMDTVIFGPGGMAQMHQPDEFITEAALVEGLQFIDRLAAYMRGGY